MKNVTLYEWPSNQICLECKNSRMVATEITEEELSSDTSVCLVNCMSNDGVNCKKQMLKPMEDEE